jgi:hypothetical protein
MLWFGDVKLLFRGERRRDRLADVRPDVGNSSMSIFEGVTCATLKLSSVVGRVVFGTPLELIYSVLPAIAKFSDVLPAISTFSDVTVRKILGGDSMSLSPSDLTLVDLPISDFVVDTGAADLTNLSNAEVTSSTSSTDRDSSSNKKRLNISSSSSLSLFSSGSDWARRGERLFATSLGDVPSILRDLPNIYDSIFNDFRIALAALCS